MIIKGARIIDPYQNLDLVADLLIEGERIKGIGKFEGDGIDAGGKILAPGFIDLHSHLREPGFEYKETIRTGTMAGVRGGFTTICCMPNTEPPIDNSSTLESVKEKALKEGVCEVLPIAAITRGRKGEEIVEMEELWEKGAVAFSDDGEPLMNSQVMRLALEYSLPLGVPVINHPEDKNLSKGHMNEGEISTRLGIKGIPREAEEIMIARDIKLLKLTGSRLHIAHVSTKGSLKLIRRAKEEGLRITCEVTPHHLTLTEKEVLNPPYNTMAKVNPPLRTEEDREALIKALKDGTIDIIATDHSPHSREEKFQEFDKAPFGISSLETALPSLLKYTDLDIKLIIEKLSTEPARILGRKDIGNLREGSYANLVLIDPDIEWELHEEDMVSLGKNTPFLGKRLKGRVVMTVYKGRIVYERLSRS